MSLVKFKIEAEGETQEEVQEQLASIAVQIISLSGQHEYWECTAEVVTGSRQEGYRGRSSFVFDPQA